MVIRNVQAIRATAAYMVVGHHIVFYLRTYSEGYLTQITLGSAGVDLFFVVSGYIMAATTRRAHLTAKSFIKARLTRVVPIYWLLTLVTTLLILLGGKAFGLDHLDATHLFSSLLFIPTKVPLPFVGWTLNHEVLFYGLFGVALVLARGAAQIWLVTLFIALLVLAARVFPSVGLLQTWGSTIVLEFVYGIAVWVALQLGAARRFLARALVISGVVALLVAGIFCDPAYLNDDRFMIFGLPACCVVYGAICCERNGGVVRSHWVIFQGDASYSVYLLHPFVLSAGTGLVGHLVAPREVQSYFFAISAAFVVAVAFVSGLFHSFVEVPLTAVLRNSLIRPSSPCDRSLCRDA